MGGRFLTRHVPVDWRAERWETPDDDFLAVLRVDARQSSAPTFLLLHGLEGAAESHYVRGLLGAASRRGWQANVLLFRSCGGPLNRQPRSYHSGETSDLDFVVGRLLRERPDSRLVLTGVSLGGNVLLKWLGECGEDLDPRVSVAIAISVPFDLSRCSRHIDRGLSRVYSQRFLKCLRPKALRKIDAFPGLADPERVRSSRTLWEFDDAFTSIVHGFRDAADYYEQCSSAKFLASIRRPTLLLSAYDDPFYPAGLLDKVAESASMNPWLRCEFVARGGHVGFLEGVAPWRMTSYYERRVTDFAEAYLAAF